MSALITVKRPRHLKSMYKCLTVNLIITSCWRVSKNEGLEFEASLEARVSYSYMVGNSSTNWKGIISATGGL